MKIYKYSFFLLVLQLAIGCDNNSQNNEFPHLKNKGLTPVPFHEVIFEDKFWKPRLETQAKELVPFALDKTQGAVDALEQTANFLEGNPGLIPVPHRYQSSDLYKVMEGVSYLLLEK
jgi:hypothetical protein